MAIEERDATMMRAELCDTLCFGRWLWIDGGIRYMKNTIKQRMQLLNKQILSCAFKKVKIKFVLVQLLLHKKTTFS